MNEYESKVADLLDELEDLAWNRDCSNYKINNIRNKIMSLIEKIQVPEWNKLVFRKPNYEERELYSANPYDFIVENLPDYGEEVLVTDGKHVWADSFDVDDFVYLSGTDSEIDGVIAWMLLPEPYKEG